MSEDAIEQATKCVTMRPRDDVRSLVVVIILGRTMKSLPSLIAECTRATWSVACESLAERRYEPREAIGRTCRKKDDEREKQNEKNANETLRRESCANRSYASYR